MSSWCVCQHLLVVWVSVRTGAQLAVHWSSSSGVAKEARGALLTELTLRVVQAVLERDTHTHTPYTSTIRGLQSREKSRAGPELLTVQTPVSGWQVSECPLHSQSSQWPRYKPPPVRVYPGAQS